MTRKPVFQEFLNEFQIKANRPASEAQLARAEAKLGFTLPAAVRECYQLCDGGQAQNDRSYLQLFSLEEALDYGQIPGFLDSFWGYLPFAENNDSNPICVCCKSPLAGYVVLVCHDDAPQLKYSSLEGFFQGAMDYDKDGEFLESYLLPSEFTGPGRTEENRSLARRLIDLATQEDILMDQDRTDALRFACDLLSDGDIDDICKLLRDEDEYFREHASERLKRIPGAKAREALNQLAEDFDAFVERCAQMLQRAGIETSVHAPYGKKTIRLDPGPIWLNMEMFFSDRKRPDLEKFLLERARSLIAQKKNQRK